MNTTSCPDCGHAFAMTLDRCPHCARPARFPNVAIADQPEERQALARRYDKAMKDAVRRGAEARVRDFEAATASSVAVIARSIEETRVLADSDHQGYATYYQLVEAGVRFPKGDKWDVLRRIADAALFSGYEKHVRFAALSLDGKGLTSYGDAAWVLKDDMIAHRASVFEENSVLFMKHKKIRMDRAHKLPRGHRATWAERSRLCVAKLAAGIAATTNADDLPGILLQPGATTEEDDFVEVHIGGSMTIRALDRVILMKGGKRERKSAARVLEAKLRNLGVELES